MHFLYKTIFSICLVLLAQQGISAEDTEPATTTAIKSASEEFGSIPDFAVDSETLDVPEAKFSIKQSFELSGSANYPYGIKGSAQTARYMPEFSLTNFYLNDDTIFNFSGILNLSGSLYYPTDSTEPNEHDASLSMYRLWGRIAYNGVLQATLGKQQLKFGNGFVFRPLSWFDNIKFYDQLKFSPARNALVVNLDPSLFTRFTFWGMYYNDNSFGYNAFDTAKNSFTYGGRFEWMSEYSVLGLSYNNREIDLSDSMQTAGFNDTGTEDSVGIDLRLTFLTLNLFSDVSYSKDKDIDSLGSSYTQLQQNLGFSILAPIKGINYSFLGEYFYSKIDTDMKSGATLSDINLFHGYDLIFAVGLTSTDYLSFVWIDGVAETFNASSSRLQSIMLRWNRSFNYLSYGINLYVNKGFDFVSDSSDGMNLTDSVNQLLVATDKKIYGIQASFKYTLNNDFKVE